MNVLSFDIEISDLFELKAHEDINKYAPFHISVASTVIAGGEDQLWYSSDSKGTPRLFIAKETANELLAYLKGKQEEGYMVCAWNGLGFDVQWIGHNADNMKLAAEVARKMYDPMFQFFNQRGFPISLASAAKGMGIRQTKLMKGEDAPKEWHRGNYQKVMEYVKGDSEMTNLIVQEILRRKQIAWVTQSGMVKSEPMAKLKRVEEVLRDPEPDQSWMKTKLPRSNFYQWFPK